MFSSPQVRLGKLVQFAQRLGLFLAKGPVYHYTYGRWRLDGWWRKRRACFSDIDDSTLFAQLELKEKCLSSVEIAVTNENWENAKSELTAYFRTRSQPKFHFDWKDRAKIAATIKDEQKQATIHAADEVCQNVFHFRQATPVKFEHEVDWAYCPEGNTDWRWDLNRHSYFVTLGKAYWYTGDEKYAEKFTQLLLDWIDANPAGVGRQNWDSVLEVAVRINTWMWAYFLFRQTDVFGQDEHITFLKGILTHARYLAARIERHAVNNHLLLEAKALALCGLVFPEFKESRVWKDAGLKILWEQVEKQICEDGVHGERATLYHWLIASELLEMMVFLQNNGIPVPHRTRDRFERMLDFQFAITKPDGSLALFGDSALTDSHARFSPLWGGVALFGRSEFKVGLERLDEETAWLMGWKRLSKLNALAEAEPDHTSRAFPQGGYFVMRDGWGRDALYLGFDCGPFGYPPLPAHGHADVLSFEAYAYGRTLLTDCGVYSYHLGDNWRNYFRGTRAHNTVVVDRQDQSVLVGRRDVGRAAQATLHEWVSNPHFDFIDGAHDGYCRLPQAVIHRRKLFFVKGKPAYWVVIDILEGLGEHHLGLNWHLMPQAKYDLDAESKTLYTRNERAGNIVIAPLCPDGLDVQVVTGATEPIQGWVSFYSGQKVSAPVLCYSQTACVPMTFQTLLYPCPPGPLPRLKVAPLEVTTCEQQPRSELAATGFRLETDECVDHLLIAHHDEPRQEAFAGYESDADIVHIRKYKEDDTFSQIMLKQAQTLSFHGKPLVKAQVPVKALTLVRQGSTVEITSSEKTALWVHAPDSKAIRLNGQDVAFSRQGDCLYL